MTPKTPGQRSPAMERMALMREYEICGGPGPVKTNQFIRKLHDIVGHWEMVEERGRASFNKPSEDPPYLVFEWMDHVLWDARTEPYRQLAHWLGHEAMFGIGDKVVEDHTESWCIAKIDRLVGPLGPPVQNPEYESIFSMADEMSTGTYIHPAIDGPVPYIDMGALRQELESLWGPKVDPGLLDFIDSLLIVDHTKRPTAAEAFEHPYLRSNKL
ncbi:MAG: hypothetical protein Q9175_002738 [Cornicularia normoerica]